MVTPPLMTPAMANFGAPSFLTKACKNDDMTHMGDAVTSTRP